MDILIIILLAFSTLGLLIYSTKSHPKKPIKVNTHNYIVSLLPHEYRITELELVSNERIRTWMLSHKDEFLAHLTTGVDNRPSGSLVSWTETDSNDWFHKTGRYVSRSVSRTSGNISDPIGWTQRFITIREPHQIVKGDKTSSDTHLFERGHLVPFWITQDEISQYNLIPITQYTNKGFEGGDESQLSFGSINAEAMLSVETEFRNYVTGKDSANRLKNNIVQLFVEPIYNHNSFVPIRINYYFQVLNVNGSHRKSHFMGVDVPASKLLKISIPVQLSDGSIVTSVLKNK